MSWFRKKEHSLVLLIRSKVEKLEDMLGQKPKQYDVPMYIVLKGYLTQTRSEHVKVPSELKERVESLDTIYIELEKQSQAKS